jgi:hypothetical protein
MIGQFTSTFAVWTADALTLSPVIALVCLQSLWPESLPGLDAINTIPSYAVWEAAAFMLNVLAFIMAGLQLRPILTGLQHRWYTCICLRGRSPF